MSDTLRLNVKADKDQIEILKETTGIRTNQDLINNALSLLTWAMKEKMDGKTVGSIDERTSPYTYKEIVMPALDKGHYESN